MRNPSRLLLPLLAALLFVAAGCSRPEMVCTSPEDNPRHHYSVGMEMIEQGRLADASAKFDRSLRCDRGFGPGYAGRALYEAYAAAALPSGEMRQEAADKSFYDLKRAFKRAETKEDEFAYYLASMRVDTVLKPRKWLRSAEGGYRKAMKLKVDENALVFYDGREAAPYFMGVAYLEAGEFQKARDRFGDVLGLRREGKWNEKADRAWKKTDKIVRALAGITLGDIGTEIAVKDRVSRGDMAALLVDELKIDRLFAGRIPVSSEIERMKPGPTPVDVAASPFKQEILLLMKWGVRGLEPVLDPSSKEYLFGPDRPVLRKDFALVLEDVLIKLTGDETISSAYFGHRRSPFPDVRPDSAWYNAIMNVTTRNLMETELSGEFRPDDEVDGAEAILAVRVLKQRLNIY
ncbi:MAG: S-layer homology domain-containing protein [Thermodesulfobacteriota bacterium]